MFGDRVAVVELAANSLYHIAITLNYAVETAVNMFEVSKGASGWATPTVTPLANLPAPWAWASTAFFVSVAAWRADSAWRVEVSPADRGPGSGPRVARFRRA